MCVCVCVCVCVCIYNDDGDENEGGVFIVMMKKMTKWFVFIMMTRKRVVVCLS